MRGVWAMVLVMVLGCGDTSTRGDANDEVAAPGDVADAGGDDADQGDTVAPEVGDGAVVPEVVDDTSAAEVADDTAVTEVDDASAVETQEGDISPEVSEDVAETADASPGDATFPSDRPRGQCAGSSDCPGALLCAESAPGGICNGCGGEPCPEGTACNQFGACSRDCAGDDECPVGMRCHPSQDICALVVCALNADCEAPYVCDAGFCRRPACDAASPCPASFACVGGVCVEPYWSE